MKARALSMTPESESPPPDSNSNAKIASIYFALILLLFEMKADTLSWIAFNDASWA